MRITNSMITLHSQRNINQTKGLVDTYNEQMTTQKKISKPSDDPVVAIRSLRLRDSLSEVKQYTEKNIPDATSWFEVTETALTNISKNLEDAYNGGLTYDVTDLKNEIIAFAASSTNQSDYCMKLVKKMKFKSSFLCKKTNSINANYYYSGLKIINFF